MLELFAFTSILLFTMGLHAFLLFPQFLRKVMAINVMNSALFLFIVVMARRGDIPDPVAHSLVLTGIVVALAVTAFALTLAGRIYKRSGARELRAEEDL